MEKKRFFVSISIIILILAGIIFLTPAKRVLEIKNRKNPKQFYYMNADKLEGFDISYTHSVNKGRVHDHYQINKEKDLLLTSTRFISYGAGIPEPGEMPGAHFEVLDNEYIIRDINRSVPKLTMAVGLIANHSLTFYFLNRANDKTIEYKLTDIFAPQTSITFEIKRVSLIKYLTHQIRRF